MRIGGELKQPYRDPEEWVRLVKGMTYSAATAPVDCHAPADVRAAYKRAAKENDIVIGEVGIWKNCLSLDEAERKAAMEYSKEQLAFAEELEAGCCVNVAGNRGGFWCGCSEHSYTEETYTMIVDMVREIIDAVKPKKTFFTLEPMPWMVPDSPEQYLKLLKDVDRAAFGVHLDITNLIYTPKNYCNAYAFIKNCFELLGPYIKSVHAKDIVLEDGYSVVFREVVPGTGSLDYTRILPYIEALGPDTTMFTEHLPDLASYQQAVKYMRECAEKTGIVIK